MKGTLRFELKIDKSGKHGKVPISMIYSVMSKRARVSTGLTIHEIYWDKKTQRAKFLSNKASKLLMPEVDSKILLTENDVKGINHVLDTFKSEIKTIENRFSATEVGVISKVFTQLQTNLITNSASFQPLIPFQTVQLINFNSFRF